MLVLDPLDRSTNTHSVHTVNVNIAEVYNVHWRTAARLEDLWVCGRGLGKGHGKWIHRVCDTHSHERIAELLRRLPGGGYLAQVVR